MAFGQKNGYTPGVVKPAAPPKAGFGPHPGYNPGKGYVTPGGWNAPQAWQTDPSGLGDKHTLQPANNQPGGGGTGSGGATTPGISPLDSTYYANVAQHQFDVNNRVNALNQAGGYGRIDLQNALSQLAYQKPLDELHATQSANNRGALFSTVLGQQLGGIGRSYVDRQSADQQQFTRAQAARDAEARALLGGVPLFNEQQAEAAALRAAAQAAADKSLGVGSPAGAGGGAGGAGGGGSAGPVTPTWNVQPGGDQLTGMWNSAPGGDTPTAPILALSPGGPAKLGVHPKPVVLTKGKATGTITKLASQIAAKGWK